jgi:hypothetical protein
MSGQPVTTRSYFEEFARKARDEIGWPFTIQLVVQRGNDLMVMNVNRFLALKADLGSKIGVRGGGYIEKIADDGWVQWAFHPPMGWQNSRRSLQRFASVLARLALRQHKRES